MRFVGPVVVFWMVPAMTLGWLRSRRREVQLYRRRRLASEVQAAIERGQR